HHAVCIWIHMQSAMSVAPRRLLRFGLAIHPPPSADDHLDVLGSAGSADREQSLFGLRRRHPRERSHLGVRQLSARQRILPPRQRAKSMRHADIPASSTEREPHAPGEPMGARGEAIAPTAPFVERTNEVEQPRGRGVEMRSKLRDLIAEALELEPIWMSRREAWTVDVHND